MGTGRIGAILGALAIFILADPATSQNHLPSKQTLSLAGLKPSAHRCESGLGISFINDTRILITNPICGKDEVTTSYQFATVTLDGTLRASIELDDNSKFCYVGPTGYIFIPAGGKGWLIFDEQLRPLGSVPIEAGESEGGIVLSPSQTAVALIFTQGDGYSPPWRYLVLAGRPLSKAREFKSLTGADGFVGVDDSGSLETASPDKLKLGAFELSTGELWFFDANNQHSLTKRTRGGANSPLPEALWLAPHDANTWCSGQLSKTEPRRFLAHCKGNTSPLGRALPIGWSHNRFIVYDAAASVLFKLDLDKDSSVAMSPNGHSVAVSRGRSIDLYALP